MSEKYNKVKTAVVGCGMISNIYIRNLNKLFNIIDLAAVCDLHEASAQEKAQLYGIDRVMTIDEVAASDEIELVVNLTGPTAHYGVIRQMLEAGKNVYTEKMFTTELDQARELVDLAKEKGLYIGVSPDTVLGAGIQTARKLIDCGLVGTITSGFVSVTRNQNLNSEVFRFLQRDGGALIYDVGIYYIGALVALLGPVKAIRAFAAPALQHEKELLFDERNADSWTIPGNNLVAAALEFQSGALVSIHFNGNTVGGESRSFALYGTEGSLELGDPNTFNGYVKLQRPEAEPCTVPFTHGYDGRNLADKPSPFDGYGNRGLGVAELAYAMRQHRPNRLSKEYGLHCEEVLIGMDIAAQTGTTYEVQSSCEVKPLKSGYYSSMYGTGRGDAERSLMD